MEIDEKFRMESVGFEPFYKVGPATLRTTNS